MSPQVFDVEGRAVGDGAQAFVAAEIGINHNGSIETAHRMIDAAASAGADAVKFQSFRADDFLSDRSLTYDYVSQGEHVLESQFEMFRRYELSSTALRELKEHCDSAGVIFFSTPTSEEGVRELVDLGCMLLKNGSDYLGHLDLIRAMAVTGLPTVLSTGMATQAEIKDAVSAFRAAGGTKLVLLLCTSVYPAPAEEVNLRRLGPLREVGQCPVGFSDHTEGTTASVGAIALGACFIEKHFTLDKNDEGPDHSFSADPAELSGLVRSIRTCEAALGQADLGPTASEMKSRREFRLSCVAARDLPRGHRLEPDDVEFKRPGRGIPPRDAPSIFGRELRRSIRRGHAFGHDDLA